MEKALPHSKQHENAVLSCCLLAPMECVPRVLDMFGEEQPFYIPTNAHIYAAIRAIDAHKISVLTVVDYLENSNTLALAGGMSGVRDICNAAPSIAQFDLYIEWVGRLHQLRRLIAYTDKMSKELYNPKAKMDEVVERATIAFNRTLSNIGSDSVVTMADAVSDAIGCLDEQLETLPTGYRELDRMLELPPGSLVLLAARPGCGKTCLATSIILGMGYRNIPSAMFSLEMPKRQLMGRMVSSVAEVNSRRIKEPKYRSRVIDAYNMIQSYPIYIDDKPSLTISEFIRKCKRLHVEYGVKFVVADYLQRMNLEPTRGEQREQTVARAAKDIKNMLLETGMRAFVLAQLNRSAAEGMPSVHHLRESGALEQEADAVILLHSDKVPLDELQKINSAQKAQQVQCIIGKNRHGPTGILELPFWKPYVKFGMEIEDSIVDEVAK